MVSTCYPTNGTSTISTTLSLADIATLEDITLANRVARRRYRELSASPRSVARTEEYFKLIADCAKRMQQLVTLGVAH